MSEKLAPSEKLVPFELAEVFLLKAKFGYRKDPIVLERDSKVESQQIHVSVSLRPLNSGEVTQVLVRVATNPENAEEHALYDFEVVMSGVVHAVNREEFPDPLLAELVGAMLFPFVREAVANLTMRGRFGPVWLRPMNLPALIQRGGMTEVPDSEVSQ